MSAAVSTLTAWVVMPDGEVVRASSIRSLTLDERWSPYVQASAVIPYTAARAALLDPRPLPHARVRIGLRRAWAGRPTALDFSEAWVGRHGSDLTAEWVGLTAGALSTAWFEDWGAGDKPSDTLTADLVVRRRRAVFGEDVIEITAVSDELLAQGEHVFAYRPIEPLSTRIRALLTAAGIVLAGDALSAGDTLNAPALTSSIESFKSTVWDLCAQAVAAAGMRLYCDEARTWHLVDPAAAPIASASVTRATMADDTIDLDGDYADVYGVLLTGTDGTSPVYLFDSEPAPLPAGPLKIAFDVEDHPEITGGAFSSDVRPSVARLTAQYRRLNSQGRTVTATAPADLTLRPSVAITTGAPSLPALDGVLAAVTFAIPEDTMTIATRSTVQVA